MRLNELHNMWEADSEMDSDDLSGESLRIPKLHAKYLRLLGEAKLALRKAESQYMERYRLKERYFNGLLTKEELSTLGWSPYQYTKPLKNQIDGLITSEPDVVTLTDKIEYWKTVVHFLDQVMKGISARSWDIRNAIEWRKLQAGL